VSIYDRFVEAAAAEARAMTIGDPFDESTQHGPQVDEKQFNSVLSFIQSGKDDGAKVVAGGKRWGNKGYFIGEFLFIDCESILLI
jgi:aldehyde dehydrogenase (NAD+)